MRVHVLGDSVRVTVSAAEVDRWNARWPCSVLRGAYSFTFDAKGDLVDRTGRGDGPELVALSQDAQNHAAGVLRDRRLLRE